MKFGWLHDAKNEQKWEWCRQKRAAGHVVGIHWYLTDADAIDRGGVHGKLASNYSTSLAGAIRTLHEEGVVGDRCHFLDRVPPGRSREAWTARAIETLGAVGCTAVLLDPDTGVEPGSTSGREHVARSEIVAFAERFRDVAIFQHTTRSAGQRDATQSEIAGLVGARRSVSVTDIRSQHFLIEIASEHVGNP